MRPIIKLRGVTKSYGGVRALQGVDLEVKPGDVVSVIGPSGSGKSTLLRVLMMLDRPDAGVLEIDGHSPWIMERGGRSVPADERHHRMVRGKVGMVFQQFNLFPHMTAVANVMEAPVHVLGMPADAARERALEQLQQVGLANRADAYPAQLSGGQKQRVAIARALAMRPEVMLFDEITSALDPELVGGILALVRDLATRRTMTLVVVTHHMAFAESCSDRVVFFDGGAIVEDGAPEEIFRRPRHERTRRFVQAVLETVR